LPTILVTGATGFVGRHVVVALRAAGHTVRCASRSVERARACFPELDWVELDLLRPDTIAPALAGCDAAVFLVHAMGAAHGAEYPERERAGAEAFAAAAGRAGLRRIVYLGGVVPATGASRHLRSRQRTGEILRAGPVETIELRAAMVIGAGGASWVMVRDLARRLPAMVLPRWLRNTSFPIAIADVVYGLVAALELPGRGSRVYELPGLERMTHREILVRTAAAMGRRRLLISVPILTPRLSSYWIALVTRTNLAMARELVEGVRFDLTPTGESLWDEVAHRPRSIDDAIRAALDDESAARGPGSAIRGAVADTLAPHRARSLVTLVVATVGFALALALRTRFDPWRSTALAAIVSAGLSLWALRGRSPDLWKVTARGIASAVALGGVLVAATHAAFHLGASWSPSLARSVHALYASVDVGANRLALVALTTVVVIGEELVWRGVAMGLVDARSPVVIGTISVALYLLPQLVVGVPLLMVAAVGLGTVLAVQRLRSGRLVDPVLTHLIWSGSIFVFLPLV